jgi:uroporphyrinogen III methyltransferase/synthase
VVTRSRTQASELVRTLRELGADVFEFPTIKVERPDEPEPFDPIGTYDWVVFTSVNGVDMLFQRLAEQGADARDLHGVRLCAIGSATADAIRQRFLNVDLMPGRYVAEELMRALETQVGDLAGKRFLLPRADIARSMLPDALRERGAEVTELVAYRTVAPEASDERARALVDYDPDLLTFTSSSTARNLRAMIGAERFAALGRRAAVACIGPVTAETAGKLGLEVAIQPEQHDIPNLVAAIVAWARGE